LASLSLLSWAAVLVGVLGGGTTQPLISFRLVRQNPAGQKAAGGVRTAASGHPRADELADAVDGLLALREHEGEEVPDVDHVVPGFEGDIHSV